MLSITESEFMGVRLRTFKHSIFWYTIWPKDQDPSGAVSKRNLQARSFTKAGSINKAKLILLKRYHTAHLDGSLPEFYRL